MSDPKEIYLGPACEDQSPGGRTWAEDNPYEDCNECGAKAVRYVLASDYDALAAECERLRNEQGAEMFLTLTGEIVKLKAELAALKGGLEAVAFTSERKLADMNAIGVSSIWPKRIASDGDIALYTAPPAQASAWVPEGLRELAEAVATLDKVPRTSGHALPKPEQIRAEAAVIRAARAMLAAAPTPGASDGK